MKLFALIAITLIASTTCVQMTSYKKLAAHQSFGNLFAQIKSMIEAGGPLANIEGLLDDLTTQIRDEQHSHDDMLSRNQASCVAEHDFRTGEIDEAEGALERAQNHQNACSASLGKTLVDITRTEEDIVSTTESLATARSLRASEHAHYVTVVADHEHMSKVLDGAMDLLDDFVTQDAELIQLSKQTAIMAKQSFKIQQTHMMAPVIAMFAQMATSEFDLFLDAGSVERIKALIQACEASTQASLNEYHSIEGASQAAFDILEAQLVESLATLKATLSMLKDHAEEMRQCVLEESVVIVKSQEKVERNTNLLNLSVEMCDAFVAEHAAATAGRDEELELLVVVRQMVQKRFNGMGASVVARDDEFDNTAVSTYEGDSFEVDGGNRDNALAGYGF